MEDLKRMYVETLLNITDVPRIYIEGSFYFVLSSTIGKFFVCPVYPRPPDNPMKPNVWLILAGRSSVLRKSTLINYSINVIKKAWLRYYSSKASHLTNDVISQLIEGMFIETGSPEGLAEYISEAQKDRDMFILISYEFGDILQQIRNKDYMAGFTALLSRLFSAESYSWRGTRKTRFIKSGLYVTALFGIQDPWIYMDSMIFRQGFMRRVILLYAKPEDKEKWLPPLDRGRLDKYEDLNQVSENISRMMLEYESMYPIIADFTYDSMKMINDYAKYLEDTYANDETNFSYYAQALWDHVVRLSILEAVNRRKPKDMGMSYRLIVEKDDVEEVMRFVNFTMSRAREAIVRTEVPIVKRPIVMDVGPLELVYHIIRETGEQGVSASELLRKTRILKDELKKYIVQLMEEEKIIAVVKRKSSRGRPQIRFYDKRYENKVAIIGDILSVNAIKEKW